MLVAHAAVVVAHTWRPQSSSKNDYSRRPNQPVTTFSRQRRRCPAAPAATARAAGAGAEVGAALKPPQTTATRVLCIKGGIPAPQGVAADPCLVPRTGPPGWPLQMRKQLIALTKNKLKEPRTCKPPPTSSRQQRRPTPQPRRALPLPPQRSAAPKPRNEPIEATMELVRAAGHALAACGACSAFCSAPDAVGAPGDAQRRWPALAGGSGGGPRRSSSECCRASRPRHVSEWSWGSLSDWHKGQPAMATGSPDQHAGRSCSLG